MNREALDELKRQTPLLDYLQAHDWRAVRQLSRGRWMGLCPLHRDHHPSFVVDPGKGLFYCYGCGRGGDVIRFAEIYHEVRFPEALSLLRQWRGLTPLLDETARFYQLQLHRHGEAISYLHQRGIHSPELIEHMRIGYAPGGCLRGWLMELGHPLAALQRAGLVTADRPRCIHASDRLSTGRQSLRPQHLGFGAAAPVSAGLQGRPVWLGASSPAILK